MLRRIVNVFLNFCESVFVDFVDLAESWAVWCWSVMKSYYVLEAACFTEPDLHKYIDTNLISDHYFIAVFLIIFSFPFPKVDIVK